MSKANVLHAEIKAQRLANLALRDQLDETRDERDEALRERDKAWAEIAEVERLTAERDLLLSECVRLRAIVLDSRNMTPDPAPCAESRPLP
jgi:hypothetical protein